MARQPQGKCLRLHFSFSFLRIRDLCHASLTFDAAPRRTKPHHAMKLAHCALRSTEHTAASDKVVAVAAGCMDPLPY